ncbi:peptide-methionine (R)-S-oxide reductase MsrB [Roseibium sp. SCP14]|uniref:peptide-methionine (R)-S-oxide reductase MsrB n=1 Tax=Roseibium sp. SCP14 TaxID=3141375 RepID=UPI003336F2AF
MSDDTDNRKDDTPKVRKTTAEWMQQLTAEQFYVTRQSGTERPFTGPYWDNNLIGRYDCVCCNAPLFMSDTKFDAGCGWPSFFKAVHPDAIRELQDNSHGMIRTEIRCRQCDAHLGHVFPDGPPPTGLRYCMNGHAMNFVHGGQLPSAVGGDDEETT